MHVLRGRGRFVVLALRAAPAGALSRRVPPGRGLLRPRPPRGLLSAGGGVRARGLCLGLASLGQHRVVRAAPARRSERHGPVSAALAEPPSFTLALLRRVRRGPRALHGRRGTTTRSPARPFDLGRRAGRRSLGRFGTVAVPCERVAPLRGRGLDALGASGRPERARRAGVPPHPALGSGPGRTTPRRLRRDDGPDRGPHGPRGRDHALRGQPFRPPSHRSGSPRPRDRPGRGRLASRGGARLALRPARTTRDVTGALVVASGSSPRDRRARALARVGRPSRAPPAPPRADAAVPGFRLPRCYGPRPGGRGPLSSGSVPPLARALRRGPRARRPGTAYTRLRSARDPRASAGLLPLPHEGLAGGGSRDRAARRPGVGRASRRRPGATRTPMARASWVRHRCCFRRLRSGSPCARGRSGRAPPIPGSAPSSG